MKFATYLAHQAQVRGDKIAAVCGPHSATFRQLEQRSNAVAHWLQQAGVKPGDRVALYLPNCIEFIAIFFAIVKAGALAVPVNMRLAAPEIAFILDDSAPCLAFVTQESGDTFLASASPNMRCVMVGGDPDASALHYDRLALAHDTGTPPDIPPSFDDCMISYTSGTTGLPKGAVLTQSNYIVMNGYMNALYWHFQEPDRILITTPLAHRTAFARMGNMLVLGATLVILPRFDPAAVAETIAEQHITVLGLVPTVARMLMPAIAATPERFASLRRILATGESFPVALKRELLERLPQVSLYSFYSSTEAGVVTQLPPEDQLTRPDSVGRALPGVEVRLVDEHGADVPVGEVGEIWVRTGEPGRFLVMKGYFNRPQANAESLRNGWFITGDMARVDDEGYYTIVDRKKDMILSGGYNIYSKEVELALTSHRAVSHAAVVGVPDPIFGEAVAAFVVLRDGTSATADELIRWSTQSIASYKKPKYVHFVEALPENSTGKVQKQQLSDWAAQAISSPEADSSAP